MKPLPPLNADEFDYWKAQHLLNRAGFGGSPADVRSLANMGLDGAVEYLVDYLEIEAEPIRADRFNPDIMQPMSRQDRTRLQAARRGNDEAILRWNTCVRLLGRHEPSGRATPREYEPTLED